MVCEHCNDTPCHRVTYLTMLRSAADSADDSIPPNTARRMLYRSYIGSVYGYLGRGNRVVVPSCVKDLIREMFPDPQGQYMGHKNSEVEKELEG